MSYGRAIGSVIGATMVVGAVGGMARRGKKLVKETYKPKQRRKRK